MSQNTAMLAAYEHIDSAVDAIKGLERAGLQDVRAYVPFPDHHVLEDALGYKESPVRIFTLVGGLTGAATGFAFTIFSVQDWPLITGGKPLLSIPAFVVIAFELTILFGALATVIGLFINARLPNLKPAVIYDPGFSAGRIGVYVDAPAGQADEARRILEKEEPVEFRTDAEVAHG